ncbi:MAG TPA: CbbQ/NirQ/NorQ/GpvN family protein [Polyangiaceae bacterium]|nr:CbbQ/NirQ/NorQ/GpvN family protein [Polyangiaceae bacterium]
MSEGLLEAFRIRSEPYYLPLAAELSSFEAAYAARLPVMLKGPTGCGKTRFVEHMAWRLKQPLITVACNEELSASDLLGRYLLEGGSTRWHDGPLSLAARHGAICYLDEVVEARQDTLVVIHPLTDDRRLLSLPAKSEAIRAHPQFHLVVSHNPGYQSALKDLKPSTKQRFAAIEFDYPTRALEVEILVHETGLSRELAERLVSMAEAARRLKGQGLDEGVSTRMLVHAGSLIRHGLAVETACRVALVQPLSDDPELISALTASVRACL